MTQVYFADWKEDGLIGMVSDFTGASMSKAEYEAITSPWHFADHWEKAKALFAAELQAERWRGIEVLFAAYTYESYSGEAFVLFVRDGKLFEVNGSHCSCYGLGDQDYGSGVDRSQWEPEETNAEAIKRRFGGYGLMETFEAEIRAALLRTTTGQQP